MFNIETMVYDSGMLIFGYAVCVLVCFVVLKKQMDLGPNTSLRWFHFLGPSLFWPVLLVLAALYLIYGLVENTDWGQARQDHKNNKEIEDLKALRAARS